jgi:hypothetical protein
MRRSVVSICLPLVLFALSSAPTASAGTITVGPYEVDEYCFPDKITQVDGPLWEENAPGWLEGNWIKYCTEAPPVGRPLTQSAGWWAYGFVNLASDMTFDLEYVDNTVINGAGADIIIFELNLDAPGGYMLAVPDGAVGFTAFRTYGKELAVPINERWPYALCGSRVHDGSTWWVSRIEIDLSDFGLIEGTVIDRLRLIGLDQADPAAVAARYSGTPVPVAHTTWGAVKALYR